MRLYGISARFFCVLQFNVGHSGQYVAEVIAQLKVLAVEQARALAPSAYVHTYALAAVKVLL